MSMIVDMTDPELMKVCFERRLTEIAAKLKIDGRVEYLLAGALYAIKDCGKKLDDETKELEKKKQEIKGTRKLIREFSADIDELDDLYRHKLRGNEIPDREYDLIMDSIHKKWAIEGEWGIKEAEWTSFAATASST